MANVLSAVVLAVGYHFVIRLYREWVRQNGKSGEAGGRPMAARTTSRPRTAFYDTAEES